MLAKILNFSRSGRQPEPVQAGPKPGEFAPDHPIVQELLAQNGLVEIEEPDRQSLASVTRQFLDTLMAEAAQLYALDGRPPPERLKLEIVHKRYQQLCSDCGWPWQDRAQLAKQLVLLGCRSERIGTGNTKARWIAFPSYPASRLK